MHPVRQAFFICFPIHKPIAVYAQGRPISSRFFDKRYFFFVECAV